MLGEGPSFLAGGGEGQVIKKKTVGTRILMRRTVYAPECRALLRSPVHDAPVLARRADRRHGRREDRRVADAQQSSLSARSGRRAGRLHLVHGTKSERRRP